MHFITDNMSEYIAIMYIMYYKVTLEMVENGQWSQFWQNSILPKMIWWCNSFSSFETKDMVDFLLRRVQQQDPNVLTPTINIMFLC